MAKFRKTDTGEIVNVVAWGANGTYTDYYDSEGVFHHSALNRYNHFEEIIENLQNGIDWEQRRYEIAKSAMIGVLASPIVDGIDPNPSIECVAHHSVLLADALIEELKKQDNG